MDTRKWANLLVGVSAVVLIVTAGMQLFLQMRVPAAPQLALAVLIGGLMLETHGRYAAQAPKPRSYPWVTGICVLAIVGNVVAAVVTLLNV